MRRVPQTHLWLLRPAKNRGEDDTFNATNHNMQGERDRRRVEIVVGGIG